jgi:hypothetical protein
LGNLSTPKGVQKLQKALHAKAKAEAGYRFYACTTIEIGQMRRYMRFIHMACGVACAGEIAIRDPGEMRVCHGFAS